MTDTLKTAANTAGIYFGSAIQRYTEITGDPAYDAIIQAENNIFTVGGDYYDLFVNNGNTTDSMKFKGFQPTQGTFDGQGVFQPVFNWGVDAFCDYARQYGLKIHGHCLIYNYPGWLKNGVWTAAQLQAIAKAHIQGVVAYYAANYPDVVVSWDVVNETIVYNHPFSAMFPGDPNPFRWAEQCFIWAREVAPSTLKLIWNEPGAEFAGSTQDTLFNAVSSALSRGVPIDGFGFQCHLSVEGWDDIPSSAAWNATLERFGALGIEIRVSELSFPITSAEVTPQLLAQQSAAYQSLISITVNKPFITGITLWDMNDKYCFDEYPIWEDWGDQGGDWVSSGLLAPGLFDHNHTAKPAYSGALQGLLSNTVLPDGRINRVPPSVSLRPVVAALTLSGVSTGSFGVTGVSLVPSVASVALRGEMAGGFAIPALSVQPDVSSPDLAGQSVGIFSPPQVALRPSVSATLLSGSSQGAFAVPAVSASGSINPPVLVGVGNGGNSIRAPDGVPRVLRNLSGQPITIKSV